MYYGGEVNVPGAPGNLGNMAGVSFPIPGGASIGKPLLPNFRELKGDKRDPSFPPEENIPRYLLPQAGILGAAGNMAGIANATFYAGPQFNQPGNVSLPAGFQNKMVS